MKTITIEATSRNVFGKTEMKKLRAESSVPCVLYTRTGAIHISIPSKVLVPVLYTPDAYLVTLSIDGKSYKSVITNSSWHPVHDYVLDVEFKEVYDDRPIDVNLPIQLIGTSPGVLAGGKLVMKAKKLRVRGFYNNIPEAVNVDISGLKLGRSIKVGDLAFENYAIAMAKDVPIASIEIPRALRQEAAQAAKGK